MKLAVLFLVLIFINGIFWVLESLHLQKAHLVLVGVEFVVETLQLEFLLFDVLLKLGDQLLELLLELILLVLGQLDELLLYLLDLQVVVHDQGVDALSLLQDLLVLLLKLLVLLGHLTYLLLGEGLLLSLASRVLWVCSIGLRICRLSILRHF